MGKSTSNCSFTVTSKESFILFKSGSVVNQDFGVGRIFGIINVISIVADLSFGKEMVEFGVGEPPS